ncbi:hypothetical protein [Kiloniella sp. b19]|uniref:hypothetical protein n=1 Tax=Kiloniella sp. GXU_MW_B19 TaxID=3141326 RepID=UPI0031DF9119
MPTISSYGPLGNALYPQTRNPAAPSPQQAERTALRQDQFVEASNKKNASFSEPDPERNRAPDAGPTQASLQRALPPPGGTSRGTIVDILV